MTEPAPRRYVLIGAGGIGSWLLRQLTSFLYEAEPGATLAIVDGDAFEPRNRSRMHFTRLGPKAVVLAEELAERYGERLNFVPVPRYVNLRNAARLIGEGDVVFLAPDNHATRRVVERRCMRLRDVALFSGGNDDAADGRTGTFGNVQIYLRVDGRDATNPLSAYHPEIEKPADRIPGAQGCTAQAPGTPQIVLTNGAVASAMLGAYYAWRSGALDWEEAYLDLLTGRVVPVRRALRPRRTRGRIS